MKTKKKEDRAGEDQESVQGAAAGGKRENKRESSKVMREKGENAREEQRAGE